MGSVALQGSAQTRQASSNEVLKTALPAQDLPIQGSYKKRFTQGSSSGSTGRNSAS